jgi:hypothetical protein
MKVQLIWLCERPNSIPRNNESIVMHRLIKVVLYHLLFLVFILRSWRIVLTNEKVGYPCKTMERLVLLLLLLYENDIFPLERSSYLLDKKLPIMY